MAAVLTVAGAATAAAQPATETAPPEVTLELIMSDPDWIGNAPESAYWADDSRSVYYFRKRAGEEERDLIQVDLRGNILRTVADEDLGAADWRGGRHDSDRSHKVYAREGDIYVKDLGTGEIAQLTRTAAGESDPRFMVGDGRVMFRRGGDVLVRDLATGLESQAFDLRAEKDPAERDEKDDYVRTQQERLLEVVRTRREKEDAARERRRAEQAADPTRPPLPWWLGDKVRVDGASLSPAGRWVLVTLEPKKTDEGTRDHMPDFITDTGYVVDRTVRTLVGTGERAKQSLALLDLETRTRHDLKFDDLPMISDDPLAELREAAEARKKAEEAKKKETEGDEAATEGEGTDDEGETVEEDVAARTEDETVRAREGGEQIEGVEQEDKGKGDTGQQAAGVAGEEADAEGEAEDKGEKKSAEPKPRPVRVSRVEWSDDGRRVAFFLFSHDNKDRWLVAVDAQAEEPALRVIEHLRDEAWVGWRFHEMGWLPDNTTLWFTSEASGYSHLYLAHAEEGLPRAATSGEHEVYGVDMGPKREALYYTATPTHPGVTELHRFDIATETSAAVTALGGRTEAWVSPDGSMVLARSSFPTHPPDLYVQDNLPGADARRLTRTVSEEFASIQWAAPEVVAVESSHGAGPIYSRVYTPADDAPGAGADGRRPAVMFVHGAGYLQNAHKGWSNYFREFMFHTLLTRAGYVVIDMDYRASAGYGRDWRTAIYRRMGEPELEDFRDGVAWLVENRNVDPARVGVYGGSYGGFMTLMALFREPDLFACGAALRPVTDWAHYNHGYTSNILNTPDLDPEAYERSSPIEFAAGLEDPMLICHGMVDDNVFFKDTVRLAQRLIELGKEDWEVAIYPVEPHGFREPSSWLDEYRRIFKLFEGRLKP